MNALVDGRNNCHRSLESGIKDINRVGEYDFRIVKLKRSNRLKPLSLLITVFQIDNELILQIPLVCTNEFRLQSVQVKTSRSF